MYAVAKYVIQVIDLISDGQSWSIRFTCTKIKLEGIRRRNEFGLMKNIKRAKIPGRVLDGRGKWLHRTSDDNWYGHKNFMRGVKKGGAALVVGGGGGVFTGKKISLRAVTMATWLDALAGRKLRPVSDMNHSHQYVTCCCVSVLRNRLKNSIVTIHWIYIEFSVQLDHVAPVLIQDHSFFNVQRGSLLIDGWFEQTYWLSQEAHVRLIDV